MDRVFLWLFPNRAVAMCIIESIVPSKSLLLLNKRLNPLLTNLFAQSLPAFGWFCSNPRLPIIIFSEEFHRSQRNYCVYFSFLGGGGGGGVGMFGTCLSRRGVVGGGGFGGGGGDGFSLLICYLLFRN